MTNRLSHSSSNKYQECGKAYEYHYVKGYRSTEQSAALCFGTAIDKATETYVNSRSIDKALVTFNTYWEEQEINGQTTKLEYCTKIVYANNDYDSELLTESDNGYLITSSGDKNVLESIDNIYKRKEQVGFKYLKLEEKRLLNQANWLSLRVKGILMIKEFAKIFDENIIEVLGTQVKTELVNESGDSVIGYVDMVLRWKGYDKPVVFDVKTSSRMYEQDSVLTSPQLSLYVSSIGNKYEDTDKAGYLVLHKNIRKNKIKTCIKCGFDGSSSRHKTCVNEVDGVRCHGGYHEVCQPSVYTQVIIDTVPTILKERVLENFNEINRAIDAKIFPRNFSSCVRFNGAVICPYYNLCHGDKMDGLIDKNKEKE